MDKVHMGILNKFRALKGKLIIGKKEIKGNNSDEKVQPDRFVPEPHILHDLIRGFYKPAGKPYLLSYQATESEENYGRQILWDDQGDNFIRIEMRPPDSEKDNRKKSDIAAARYNLTEKIPIGILHKIKKGHNRILGLGIITSEREDGVFIVEPFEYSLGKKANIEEFKLMLENEEINTNIVAQILRRRGQEKFKKKLLFNTQECAICGLNETKLLIASHIKPWRDSSNLERMDPNNGLLLCPNHDKLFDLGYISFTNSGNIIFSSRLSKEVKEKMHLDDKMYINVNSDIKDYLKWHRELCFKK